MIMPTELSPPLGSNPQESNISIKLKSNYIASTEITFVITKTMIQGDDSSKLQLRKVLIITYTVRLLLLSSLYFVVFSIALYIFDPSSLYFFISFASIFILFLLLLGHQTYYFIYFLVSIKDTQTFIRLNKKLVEEFAWNERIGEQSIELTTHVLPPPNYQHATNSPPAYQRN